MSFSFVDRIIAHETGKRADGIFTVPPAFDELPTCLVTEAVGQLAAWLAMAACEFRARPVAALAHAVTIGRPCPPGTCLDMEVAIVRRDRDAILYHGSARVNGERVMELSRCVGPMLPMEDFDDPATMRARFERLCAEAGDPGSFAAVDDWRLHLTPLDRKPGERLSAEIIVPERATFFADHFPRKPVLPATLLLDAMVRAATDLAREALGAPASHALIATRLREIKVRAWVAPGTTLQLGAQTMAARSASAEMAVYATLGSKQIATARVELAEPAV